MINNNNGDNGNNEPDKDKTGVSETETENGAEKSEMSELEKEANEPNSKKSAKKTSFYKKRSFKFGSMATAFTAIFVAIVILLNVVLSIVNQKFPISVDLTNSKDYGISDTTIKYLAKETKPITIKIFATKAQMLAQTYLVAPEKIIEQYPKYDGNISIQYIDYDKNPTSASAYSSNNIQTGDVVVSSTIDGKERYKHISGTDLLVTTTDSSTGQETVVGNKAEQQIDSAIDYVTSNILPKVVVISGHNEADSTSYQNLLTGGNYSVSTVNTATSKIDSNAAAIAIVAPQSDFSTSEISKIDAFLKNGGKYGKNIFIFLDPRIKKLPNLTEYMNEWGVNPGSGVIYDTTDSFDNSIYDPQASDVDASTVGDNYSSKIGTDIKVALPLNIMFSTKETRTVKSVIKTGSTSKLLTDLKSGSPSSKDAGGPFTVMTLSSWSSNDGQNKSNMIVSGSYEMTDSDLLSASNKNNSKVLLGIANTLMGKKSSISVDSKYTESSQLSLTTGQRSFIIVLFMILIPLAILIIGLVQWLRRRHL